jgi:predicted 2-oxoglutarate/Fe(II)-dependent dioxygenase YbiX
MIIIQDDFITDEEIEQLFLYFKNNKDKCMEWHGTYTLSLNENFSNLGNNINHYALQKYNAQIDWGKFVYWPKDSYQPLHFDNASNNTILSSIIYLNDDYQGGQTFFEEKTVFAPKKKRALFFDGTKYKHGVMPITEGNRYTLAIWYKPLIQT